MRLLNPSGPRLHRVLPVIVAAMLSSSKRNLILGFDHPRSASSTAVSSKRLQNVNRIRRRGARARLAF